MFPSRYRGYLFLVSLNADGKQKPNCHLFTNENQITILSPDWKTPLMTIPLDHIISSADKNGELTIQLKGDQKASIVSISCEKHEKLLTAITPTSSDEQEKSPAENIIPFFPSRDVFSTILNKLNEVASNFLDIFHSPKVQSSNLAIVLLCIYRFSFANSEIDHYDANIKSLLNSLLNFLIYSWCKSIIKASAPSSEPNAVGYFTRIVVNSASTVAAAAAVLNIDVSPFLEGVVQFAENGSSPQLAAAAEKLSNDCLSAIPTSPRYPFCLKLMRSIFLICFSAISTSGFPEDTNGLSKKSVLFTKAVSSTEKSSKVLAQDLKECANNVAHEMVRKMDSQRYEPAFHYVYCSWCINEDMGEIKLDDLK